MKKKNIMQFIAFGVVGLSNTLVSQVVFMVCIAFGWHYIPSNAAAFILSVLNAYFWQSRFVFKADRSLERRVWWKTLLKTYISYAFTGLLLNSLLLMLWIDAVKIDRFTPPLTEFVNSLGVTISNKDLSADLCPLLNAVINIPLNFVINKFWAYRQKESDQSRKI